MTNLGMIEHLTQREREAASLAASGLSNPQIGVQLSLKESTVRQYLHSVYEKTGADRRTLALVIVSRHESPK
jgi:DNA-binding CsgD family transcriptional regulator